jgi:hypothetical protein
MDAIIFRLFYSYVEESNLTKTVRALQHDEEREGEREHGGHEMLIQVSYNNKTQRTIYQMFECRLVFLHLLYVPFNQVPDYGVRRP